MAAPPGDLGFAIVEPVEDQQRRFEKKYSGRE